MPPALHENCIRELCIPKSIAEQYRGEGYANYISNISRLNVFIGPNNSGKSRLLRALYKSTGDKFSTGAEHEEDLRIALDKLRTILTQIEIPDDGLFRKQLRAVAAMAEPRWRTEIPGPYVAQHPSITNIPLSDMQNSIPQWFVDQVDENDRSVQWNAIVDYIRKAAQHSGTIRPALSLHHVYIPSFRSLHHYEELKDSLPTLPTIRRTVIREYFENYSPLCDELSGNYVFDEMSMTLFTGGELYQVLRDRLLGTQVERERIRDFETYIGRWFFNGQSITLIPRIKHNAVFVKIGNDEERPIRELGDGIQQLLIMTLPLFLFRDRQLILFIEEPELYLHPGFQRAFIEMCLHPENTSHQVFVATHSHQFIDITVDRDLCSVYRVAKQGPQNMIEDATTTTGVFRVEASSTHDFELLRLLGVRNSSLLLSNCTIWVEGITDRLYFRHYLSLYQKERQKSDNSTQYFLEDLHFSFVEYGGSNIVHWSFLDSENGIDVRRVCGNLMLIADKDKPGDLTKEKRHAKLREALGDRFILLECREVENLLATTVLGQVVQDYEGADKPYDLGSEVDYRNVALGTFLDHFVVRQGTRARRGKYAEDSGTVTDKDGFCKKACSHITEWSHLSDEAKNITEKIYRFIANENGVALLDLKML